MSYKINPVKAVTSMFKDGNCGINTVNSACYGVCAAFKGSNDNWAISPQCEAQCDELINDMRIGKYGVGWCDHHAPNRPVNWIQVPSFFPDNFNRYKDVKKALAMSYAQCSKTNLLEECKQKADLESRAVETYKSRSRDTNNNNSSSNLSNYEKANPLVFWIGFVIGASLIAVFLYVLVRVLKK